MGTQPKQTNLQALDKKARVAIILETLRAAPPVKNRDEALELMSRVFREIEDRHSGEPETPFHSDRLYPPTSEMERSDTAKPHLRWYRHTSHTTVISENGAILIYRRIPGTRTQFTDFNHRDVLLDKPGADGRRVAEAE